MEVLQKLLKDPVIQQCRLRRDGDEELLASALPNKPTTTTALPGEDQKMVAQKNLLGNKIKAKIFSEKFGTVTLLYFSN